MRLTNTLAFVFVLFAFSQALANRHSLSDFKEEKDTLLLNNMHVEGGAIVVDYSAAKHFPEKNNEKEIVRKGISQSKLIKEKSKKPIKYVKYSQVVSHHYNPSKNPFTFSQSSQLSSVFISSAQFKFDFNSVQSTEILIKDIHKYTKLIKVECYVCKRSSKYKCHFSIRPPPMEIINHRENYVA